MSIIVTVKIKNVNQKKRDDLIPLKCGKTCNTLLVARGAGQNG